MARIVVQVQLTAPLEYLDLQQWHVDGSHYHLVSQNSALFILWKYFKKFLLSSVLPNVRDGKQNVDLILQIAHLLSIFPGNLIGFCPL